MKLALEPEQIRQAEPRFELLYWIAGIGCFALVHLPGVATDLRLLYWLAAVTSVCTVVWYHVLPKSWIGFRKTFYGAMAGLGCVTIFLSITGGIRSPFGLLYMLPILASFLVLDTLRAWVVYGLALVGWSIVYFHDVLGNPASMSPLAVPALVGVFVLTLGTVFTALFARVLHEKILREREMSGALQQSQEHLKSTAEELSQANRELQRLSRTKDDFVATVNHELRTPLTAMKQGIALFLHGTLGPLTLEQREFMTMMARNLNRLTELVTNLLDLSRIQAGKLTLRIAPCGVEEIVEETMRVHQPLVGQRTVRVQLAPGLPRVLADRDRMIQVLGNLVSNAVKFTPEGGTVTIAAEAIATGVQLRVEDTGIGISPEQKDKLFQRYERLDEDPSRPGTGLGLAICRELVELQHGTIRLEARESGGTVAVVELPGAEMAATTAAPQERAR